MSMDKRRQLEVVKYKRILELWPEYGHRNHGADAVRLVAEMAPNAVVDVGCGNNAFCKMLWKLCGCNCTGVDLVHPDADIIAPAHDLPFEDKSFDVVTAFDVLEHLIPDEIDEVLDELARVGRDFVFKIAHFPHEMWGHELHLTVQPEEWWLEKIGRVGDVIEFIGKQHRSGRYMIGCFHGD
jgi:ubiquinone/menaquinone biosynthesis C-methylase UbiE